MNKKNKAIQNFYTDLNCAQAVLTYFTEKTKIDEKVFSQIASGFGAGMGRLQKTCGAVTGGIMAIGLLKEAELDKEELYQMVRFFDKKFKETHNTTVCSTLLNCDLNTNEGQQYFKENTLKDKVCAKCIINSINIVEQLVIK